MARRDEPDPLDAMDLQEVIGRLGEPRVVTNYAQPRGCSRMCTTAVSVDGEVEEFHPHWRQGDDRPVLASEDPAVMCVIGRCATNRLRSGSALPNGAGTHPVRCGFCDYPLRELLLALDWCTWWSRFVISETYHWPTYSRTTRTKVFEQPAFAAFDALTDREQAYRVAEVMKAAVE